MGTPLSALKSAFPCTPSQANVRVTRGSNTEWSSPNIACNNLESMDISSQASINLAPTKLTASSPSSLHNSVHVKVLSSCTSFISSKISYQS